MSQLMGGALSHPYAHRMPKKCEPEFFFVWQTQFSVLFSNDRYNSALSNTILSSVQGSRRFRYSIKLQKYLVLTVKCL